MGYSLIPFCFMTMANSSDTYLCLAVLPILEIGGVCLFQSNYHSASQVALLF